MSTANILRSQSMHATHGTPWWGHLLWVLAAAVVGFGVAALFSGLLQWERSLFLVPHALVTSILFYVYVRWGGLDLGLFLRRHWIWGIVGAALAGAFLVMNVLSQPASPRATGFALVFDLAWLGIVYGIADALLLSVLPILATWLAFSQLGWTGNWVGRIAVGFVALLMSLAVTAAYHLGYAEFQGTQVVSPLIGNGVSSLAYLLSNNPLGAILSHIAMHVASVLHGPATTMQLPPHY